MTPHNPGISASACFLPLTVAILAGCTQDKIAAPGTTSPRKSTVTAQGQILPANGFIRLAAAPGSLVKEVLVQVGSTVNKGDTLVRLHSEDIQSTQRAALIQKRAETTRKQNNAIRQAQQQVEAAELKQAHLASQRESLARKEEILAFAKEQVEASQRVLQQLESISEDEMTSEFVGRIEIDRQKVAVGEAELSYRQQAEAHRQAVEDLKWASLAAEEERKAALAILESAQESGALRILRLELDTLDKQIKASKIVAPTSGVVVAVNAQVGEATSSYPVVEIADVSDLVVEAEINEMDAALIQENQNAKIVSRAFGEDFTGTVSQKYSLVGRPQLRPLDPLARVDFRAITATIKIDEQFAEKAQNWLQLHVEVKIEVDSQ